MDIIMPLLAIAPIVVVGILMVGFMWPSSRAMPVGLLVAAVIAVAVWQVPLAQLIAASLAGLVNAVDILLIVFGAILILQLMKKSGGMDGISSCCRPGSFGHSRGKLVFSGSSGGRSGDIHFRQQYSLKYNVRCPAAQYSSAERTSGTACSGPAGCWRRCRQHDLRA